VSGDRAYVVLERSEVPPWSHDVDEWDGYRLAWNMIDVTPASSRPPRHWTDDDRNEADNVYREIQLVGEGDLIFGGEPSSAVADDAAKVLVLGRMTWEPNGTSDWDGGPEYEPIFEIESVRVLAVFVEGEHEVVDGRCAHCTRELEDLVLAERCHARVKRGAR